MVGPYAYQMLLSCSSGFRYGSDIIPFSKEDEEQMKYKAEAKCFSVLGFSRASQVRY